MLAQRVLPEDVQLFYQVLLMGQQDLPLAPDPRSGLEMILLRALAFRPDSGSGDASGAPSAQAAGGGRTRTGAAPAASSGVSPPRAESSAAGPAPREAAPAESARLSAAPAPAARPGRAAGHPPSPGAEAVAASGRAALRLESAEDWHRLVATLDLGGLARQLAHHCGFVALDGRNLRLALDPAVSHLRVAGAERRLHAALADALGRDLVLDLTDNPTPDETPAERMTRLEAERQSDAEAKMRADPVVQELEARFDAQWIQGSIRAVE
jgi:DNA polymerase-3 subunit gamma/tau